MSILITQTESTINSVTIWVYGMDINYPHKALSAYIDGNYYDTYEDSNSGGFGMYCTIEGLSANTSYSLEIRAFHYSNNDWYPDPSSGENFATITISTSGSGPDPGQNPDYTFTYTATSVTITIHNISGYYYSYWLVDGNDNTIFDSQIEGRTGQTEITISGLSPNTNYKIKEVDYAELVQGGTLTMIQSRQGHQEESFTTDDIEPSTDDGYVYIFTGSRWQRAKPYIFTGSRWEPATAYIFNGSRWAPTAST